MTERRREVDDLRRQMSEADAEIVRALERRARLARSIADLRGSGQAAASMFDGDAIETAVGGASEDLPPAAVRSVLREVHAATAPLEMPGKIAYPCQAGDFGHVAAMQQFGSAAHFSPAEDVAQAVEEVSRRRADLAVIPYESSTDGTAYESVVALLPTDLVLIARSEVSGALGLMAEPGAEAPFRRVYCSALHRLAARRFLSSLPAGCEVLEVASPAAAVQATRGNTETAAVVPEAFGVHAGLTVITASVGDRADLTLRYAVVSHRPAPRSGNDSTAFVFGVHDEPGALFDVLKHFAERGVSLRTIQSRPAPGERWTYLFFVEVSGHTTDRPLVSAFQDVRHKTRFFKVLGSYPSI